MGSIISSVTTVFSDIASWFVEFIPTIIGLFYVDGTGLTFLGVLAVMSLAISIFFLVMGLIQNFLNFRS